jgi:hypothetical protein
VDLLFSGLEACRDDFVGFVRGTLRVVEVPDEVVVCRREGGDIRDVGDDVDAATVVVRVGGEALTVTRPLDEGDWLGEGKVGGGVVAFVGGLDVVDIVFSC